MIDLQPLSRGCVQPAEKALIAKLYREKIRIADIPVAVGRPIGTVLTIIHKLQKAGELTPRKRSRRRGEIPEKKMRAPDPAIFEVLTGYRAGHSAKDIAMKVGKSEANVHQMIRRMRRSGVLVPLKLFR